MGLAPVTTPWTEPGRGLFSISVAAELSGLHPQTLRIYEREGLLDPARSPGGTRRYSTEDIGRLKQIMALTADGLNLAGVRRVLELQEETRQLQAEIGRLKAAARSRPGHKASPHKASPHQAGLAEQQDTSG
jgi:MerR family transcriptional regulator, heat shock protein HspR